jgi:hypothetical protein
MHIKNFAGEASRIKMDLSQSQREEFDRLRDNISFAEAYVTKQDEKSRDLIGRKKFTDALVAIISFVEKI